MLVKLKIKQKKNKTKQLILISMFDINKVKNELY